MPFRRANGRRRRRGYVGRFRRRDVSAARTIEGASRTTSIAFASSPSAASPAASRWREKEKREERGGRRTVGWTTASRAPVVVSLAGRRAIRPRTPPRNPQAIARGSAGGATRDAEGYGRRAPRSARGQIVKGAVGTTGPGETRARGKSHRAGKFEIRLRGRRGEFETGAGKFETESVPGRERSNPIRCPVGEFATESVPGREISARKRVRRTSKSIPSRTKPRMEFTKSGDRARGRGASAGATAGATAGAVQGQRSDKTPARGDARPT